MFEGLSALMLAQQPGDFRMSCFNATLSEYMP
jgi:hypothetical protein